MNRLIKWFDWYDVLGIVLVYGILVSFVFVVFYTRDDLLFALLSLVCFSCVLVLVSLWSKLSWGAHGSYLLFCYLMGALLTVPFSFYKCYLDSYLSSWVKKLMKFLPFKMRFLSLGLIGIKA